MEDFKHLACLISSRQMKEQSQSRRVIMSYHRWMPYHPSLGMIHLLERLRSMSSIPVPPLSSLDILQGMATLLARESLLSSLDTHRWERILLMAQRVVLTRLQDYSSMMESQVEVIGNLSLVKDSLELELLVAALTTCSE